VSKQETSGFSFVPKLVRAMPSLDQLIVWAVGGLPFLLGLFPALDKLAISPGAVLAAAVGPCACSEPRGTMGWQPHEKSKWS
jgi:hypothetical protein